MLLIANLLFFINNDVEEVSEKTLQNLYNVLSFRKNIRNYNIRYIIDC